MPREQWHSINKLLVGFGQTVCKIKPRCEVCDLNATCAYFAKYVRSKKGKRVRNNHKTEDERDEQDTDEESVLTSDQEPEISAIEDLIPGDPKPGVSVNGQRTKHNQ